MSFSQELGPTFGTKIHFPNASSASIFETLVKKCGPGGMVLLIDIGENANASMFFRIEFPHYSVRRFANPSEERYKEVFLLILPPGKDAIPKEVYDARFQKIKWHLSLDMLCRLLACHNRVSMKFASEFAGVVFAHMNSLPWYSRCRHGDVVKAYFKQEDKFNMNEFDTDRLAPTVLPADVAEFDFTSWTVEKYSNVFSRLFSK